MRTNKNKNYLADIKNSINNMKENKRLGIKDILMELAVIVEKFYPYNFKDSETYLMNDLLDPKAHFFFCINKYEVVNKTLFDNKFIDNLYELFYDEFYSSEDDVYNSFIKYIAYLTNATATKNDEDLKVYQKLYDSYRYSECNQ